MKEKICSKCGLLKPIEEYKKDSKTKDGYRCWCKLCKNEYDRIYRKKNADKIKEYKIVNKEKHKKAMKKWHLDNKEKEKEYRILYRERRNYLNKKWREENIDKSREWHREYRKRKRQNGIIYMKDRIRNMIYLSFKRKGYSKTTKTYKILGAEYNIVWDYLKKTWYNNYGKLYNNEPYEIDHIIPLATAKTEEDVIKLCHYTNLQLLTPEDNLKKSDKIIK